MRLADSVVSPIATSSRKRPDDGWSSATAEDKLSKMSKERPGTNRLFRCSSADVLSAFRIVGQEIRGKCHRYAKTGLTQREAYELAGRIKEQRELIRQLTDRRNVKHARRLVRLNSGLRRRAIGVIERAGLNKDVLTFK